LLQTLSYEAIGVSASKESLDMSATSTEARAATPPTPAATASRQGADQIPRLLAVGGILGALGAASCCVIPFALFLAGVSGAWIGNLTALEPRRLRSGSSATAPGGFGDSGSSHVRMLTAPRRNRTGSPKSASGPPRRWSCSPSPSPTPRVASSKDAGVARVALSIGLTCGAKKG
jgi:MerT mercuric transport protein